VHTYLGYDPKSFPSPTAPAPDLAGAAFDHMLEYGSMRDFTDEELARAVRLDPSMFPMLGPSLESIAALLRERRARILAKYETQAARKDAREGVARERERVEPPKPYREDFRKAMDQEQIRDLERLWYKQPDESSPFAKALLRLIDRMGDQYQIEQMAAKYEFTGQTRMSVPEALEVKAELEEIDKLLEQLKKAAENAQLAIIDMDALSELADGDALEGLNQIRQQIEDYLREEAKRQGFRPDLKKRGHVRSAFDGRYRFTRYFSPLDHNDPATLDDLFKWNDVELYDLVADPAEMNNLAMDRKTNAELIATMNGKLSAVIKAEIGKDDGRELPDIAGITWGLDQIDL